MSSGSCQISAKRRLKLVILPAVSTTRMPSAVESNVAVRSERASLSSSSAHTCAVASWAEITRPSTIGSSKRFTMLSSNGTVAAPSWRRRPTRTATGRPGTVPVRAAARAASNSERSPSAMMSASGLCSSRSGSCPRSRVIAPDTDSRIPSDDTSMITEPALCTSDRKRASRPPASSNRRRSVRSRRHSRTMLWPPSPRWFPRSRPGAIPTLT